MSQSEGLQDAIYEKVALYRFYFNHTVLPLASRRLRNQQLAKREIAGPCLNLRGKQPSLIVKSIGFHQVNGGIVIEHRF